MAELPCLQPAVEQPEAATSVVGALRRCWRRWEEIGAPAEVVSWVRDGVPIEPQSEEGLGPTRAKYDTIAGEEEEEWTDREIARLVQTGALEDMGGSRDPPEGIAEVSPIRLAPKAGPKRFRLVVNMRRLNRHLTSRAVKYEGIKVARKLLKKGWWMGSFDLKEGYFHAAIRRRDCKWLGIRWRGRWYRYTVLPFGLSHSPFVFTKLMRPLVERWRSMGITIVAYLDDVLFAAPTREALLAARAQIEQDLHELGWTREPTKGHWEPTQQLQFLGLVFDTLRGTLEIPADKLDKLRVEIDELLILSAVTRRTIARVSGRIISVSLAFAPARLFSRALYRTFQDVRLRRADWDLNVPISEDARRELRWLRDNLDRFNGTPLWRPARVLQIKTDASGRVGWGALLTATGSTARGEWAPHELSYHINILETRAARLAAHAFTPLLTHRAVEFLVDSRVAEAYINNGGGRVAEITAEVQRLWLWAAESRAQVLGAVWLPRAENAVADMLSKHVDTNDWSVQTWVFRLAEQYWGPHSCDFFASSVTAKCMRFFSEHWTPGCTGVNAFAQDWSQENGWVVPPPSLMLQVLQMVGESGATVTLVLPRWPAQPWWPLFLQLAQQVHVLGSPQQCLVSSQSGHCELFNNPAWTLLLARVSSSGTSVRPRTSC